MTQGNNLSLPGCKYLKTRKERQKTDKGRKSAMKIAVEGSHVEAGAILARKGADCREEEKAELGQRYTNFILALQEKEKQA